MNDLRQFLNEGCLPTMEERRPSTAGSRQLLVLLPVRRHLRNATVITVLLSNPKVQARSSMGAWKTRDDRFTPEAFVSTIVVVSLTLPSA